MVGSSSSSPPWKRSIIASALRIRAGSLWWSKWVLIIANSAPEARSRSRAQTTIRVTVLPQVAEPITSGVSESQNWSHWSTSRRVLS